MPDNPMVGYAYRYTPASSAETSATLVKMWAFVHWATPAFDGFGSCVRYEVRLVLPIVDRDGRAIRLLRPTGYAQPAALQMRVADKPVAKRPPAWEETVGAQLKALNPYGR